MPTYNNSEVYFSLHLYINFVPTGISGSLSSADNQTLCVCGEPAILLTVRKEDSSNKGTNT